MSNIIVLSVTEKFTQVTLGTWGNPNTGMYRAFALKPDTYHIRRLVTRKDSAGVPDSDTYKTVAWDVVSQNAARADLSFSGLYEQDRVGGNTTIRERWIPNTGEYLVLDTITLNVYNAAGSLLKLKSYFNPSLYEPVFTGAVDRAYDQQPATGDYGNIYRNSSCPFELAAMTKTGPQVIGWLVKKNPTDREYSFEVQYMGQTSYFYDSQQQLKRKDSIKFDDKGILTINSSGVTYKLGIRPINASAVRPGDDLLLQIGLQSKTGQKSIVVEATARERDYIVTYDKKMLWRANLYIDEGVNDWNNLHPWNVPPSGYAKVSKLTGAGIVVLVDPPAWGRKSDGSWDVDRWGYNDWNWIKAKAMKNPDTPGSGGQVRLNSWVDGFWQNIPNEEKSVSDAIPYGYGAAVSPFAFNWAIETQQEYARRYYDQINEAGKGPGKGFFAEYPGSRPGDTTFRWENYVFPARVSWGFKVQYSGNDAFKIYEQLPFYAVVKLNEMFPSLESRLHSGTIEETVLKNMLADYFSTIAPVPYLTWSYYTNSDFQVGIMKTQLDPYTITTKDDLWNSTEAEASKTQYPDLVHPHPSYLPSKKEFRDNPAKNPDENIVYLRSTPEPLPTEFDTTHFWGNPKAYAVPGLSTFLAFNRDESRNKIHPGNSVDKNPTGMRNWHQDQGSSEYTNGLDCSGFISQSLGYTTTSYAAVSVTMTNGKLTSNLPGSWGLMQNTNSVRFSESSFYNAVESLIPFMVPGDFLGFTGTPGHVIFIDEIDESWMDGTENTNSEQRKHFYCNKITTIQSSGYVPRYRVYKHLLKGTYKGYPGVFDQEDPDKYSLLRLKIKE